ncbi:uncharacterized protein Z518_01686 [Rhinocladiella mackenziei CBS 650.93]|uniref:Cohesin loading factor n=1 Tax=Rhinocladiella mackenziei CBS 650.93 TaxID=1442369 RepID=A0A0D2G6L6_9EURO|nr:uncharacterized protein Z518_01686 [Rhinocladiella mackenziei CBS 650.93]KIX10602.1 hypothetical protein Z518_01686 [Rhinocladiella mackenziei CBS 650.93]
MDPNQPFNSNLDYFYNNFPQAPPQPPHQRQRQHQPQHHHQHQQNIPPHPVREHVQPQTHLNPQSHPPTYSLPQSPSPYQSYPPQPYPQSIPQNYPQYYYDQQQSYQPPFQQYPANSIYQPSSPATRQLPPAPAPAPQPPQPRVHVVIPSHPLHSSPSQQSHQYHQSQPRPNYHPQPQPQIQTSSQSFGQHTPQQRPQSHRRHQTWSNAVLNAQSHMMASDHSRKNQEPPVPTTAAETPPKDPQQSRPRVLQAIGINTKPKPTSTKSPGHDNSPQHHDEPEPDYPSFLSVLADDYLDAARKNATLTDEYYNLVATALACLESVLSNFKLPPLREAQVSLRYAQTLYEETENYDEAETTLTKSIELCERHKFVDLKYEMQLLLSKILYESKPKAALRDIQRMIDDIEAYRHTVWLYIFRFQHAMFSLASSSPGEVHSATVQMQKISNLARQNSDSALLAFAALLEAILHLSSLSHEAITSAQTALAKARALQLNPDVESNPQITILMEFIDLSCSVLESNIVQTEKKRKIMHEVLYQSISDSNWRDDGLIYIPVSKRAIAGIQLQGNGHVVERNGRYFLPFSWLGKEEAEALGFLFSADSSAYKNGADGGKAEKFVDSGLSLVRSWRKPTLASGFRQLQRAYIFQRLLEAQFLFLLIFMQCSKGLWQQAQQTLEAVHAISEDIGDAFPINMKYGLLYLKGVILQGTGNLTAALEIYQSPALVLGAQQSPLSNGSKALHHIPNSYYADSNVIHNFRILASMNSAFIIQNPRHPQHKQLSSLISSLGSATQNSGNKYIQAHYSLLISVLSTTTLTIKQFLKSAMEAGKAIGSAQTTALALVYMQEKLFKGTVDEQALKCAKAASHQVRRWGEPLWAHVAAGLEADSLEINGMAKEAQQRKADAEARWNELPLGVKRLKTG